MVNLYIVHSDFIQNYHTITRMLQITLTQKHTLTITKLMELQKFIYQLQDYNT